VRLAVEFVVYGVTAALLVVAASRYSTTPPVAYSAKDRAQLTGFVKKLEKRHKRCVKLTKQGHIVPYCVEMGHF
jgi:hypothetical protein